MEWIIPGLVLAVPLAYLVIVIAMVGMTIDHEGQGSHGIGSPSSCRCKDEIEILKSPEIDMPGVRVK
jgi:hypothetical protein